MGRPSLTAGTVTCLLPGLVTLWVFVVPPPLDAVEIAWSGEARSLQTFSTDSAPWMTRLRSRAEAAVTPWLRTTVEAQYSDAALCRARTQHSNLDIRLAYLEIGGEGGFRVRAGRQELSWGDESLLGADSEWDNRGQAFDAAQVTWQRGALSVQAFAGALVDQKWGGVDRPRRGREIAGATAAWRSDRLEVEPFLLHKRVAESGQRFTTPGLRIALPKLGNGFSTEAMAMSQNGAWAASLTVAKQAGARLTVGGGVKVASRRFDDLFPAAYNSCGLEDPYPWSDVTDIAATVEYRPARAVHVASEWHAYSRRGTWAGSQWNGLVEKALGGGLRVGAGLALRTRGPEMPGGPAAFLLVARSFGAGTAGE